MTMAQGTLSTHDKELLARIREIDERWGYIRWPDISALADELEDESEREKWNKVCIRYNHTEEYYAGCL